MDTVEPSAQYPSLQIGVWGKKYTKKLPQFVTFPWSVELEHSLLQWKQNSTSLEKPISVGCTPFIQPVALVLHLSVPGEDSSILVPAGYKNLYQPGPCHEGATLLFQPVSVLSPSQLNSTFGFVV